MRLILLLSLSPQESSWGLFFCPHLIYNQAMSLPPNDRTTERARPLPPSEAAKILAARKPEWLKIRAPGGEKYAEIKGLLRGQKLHTVCEEAHCPNLSECWASGTATFMLGGDICTRACRFCAVKTARIPPALDPNEPLHVAQSIVALKLKYVVLTSVDRDDMADGGAGHFAETVKEIKARDAAVLVEALVSDFRGDRRAIETVVESHLDVYAHNVETVERLQYRVRDPRAGYAQSFEGLRYAKEFAVKKGIPLLTKSSVMLGLGEEDAELRATFADLRKVGVDILTLGQYLRPSMTHLPVERFYTPEEFEALRVVAESFGFTYVASGPLVRSSYKAAEFFLTKEIKKIKETTNAIHTP